LIFPTRDYPPYEGLAVYQFLVKYKEEPMLFIGFSAGVVGAIVGANLFQSQGGKVKALIAFDGWGVPLGGNFPIYRFSHDFFTHWSSAILGSPQGGFYADPPVAHLDLWRSPTTTLGWWSESVGCRISGYASEFLLTLLTKYEEI
jgi:hypothetical protein